MVTGKKYLIEILSNGKKEPAECRGKENGFYAMRFEKDAVNREKRMQIKRFESGVKCMEGTEYLVLEELS